MSNFQNLGSIQTSVWLVPGFDFPGGLTHTPSYIGRSPVTKKIKGWRSELTPRVPRKHGGQGVDFFDSKVHIKESDEQKRSSEFFLGTQTFPTQI